jgi:hypothetical protein
MDGGLGQLAFLLPETLLSVGFACAAAVVAAATPATAGSAAIVATGRESDTL